MENVLDLLSEARLKQLHKTNLVVVPYLMTFIWIIHMVKEDNLLFSLPVGMNFWG